MSGSSPSTPQEITVSREQRQVSVRWQDGHQSVFGFDLLRRQCPCAVCNDQRHRQSAGGGLDLLVMSGPILRPGEVQATDVKPMGRYALHFVWSDGHDSGIYTYTLLRDLCPCPACRSRAVPPGPGSGPR
jgi:DUF971 family protein